MMLLLYAIAGSGIGPIEGEGLDGTPLRTVAEDSLVAVVSEHDRVATHSTERSLWEYEAVVESLMDRWAILPAQYGSRFAGERELRAMVRERRAQLVDAVDMIAGAVELSVTATWADAQGHAETPDASSGTEYMLDRLSQHRRAAAIAQHLRPLSAIARASTERLLVKPTLPFVGAYLVKREAVSEFAARVRTLDERLEAADLVCTGPWPPYGFTGAATSSTAAERSI